MTYKLPGEYSAFAATVGIDAVSGNRGNAVVKIQGDGKDLIEPVTVVGGGDPLPIRCDLAGVKQLTIIVELGADGTDVGDNVDLVEARVIRK